jgi:membrane protein
VTIFDRIEAGFDRAVEVGRKRAGWFDHLWLTLLRFDEVHGVRLAAAISYYGFFAAFSLTVLAYSILGRLLGGSEAGFISTVNDYLNDQLLWVRETADQVGTQEVTVISAVALLVTGVAWVDALRSSTRAIWRLNQHPGHWILRWLVDLVMLLVLGVLLTASLGAAYGIDALLEWLAGPDTGAIGSAVLGLSGPVVEFAVNMLLSAALLTLVPRLRLSPRRLIPTALLVAASIQLLNWIGRWFIGRLDDRPAYQLVTGAVGLLIYLYLLNQLILLGCALSATATAGTVVDHAPGGSPDRADTEAASADLPPDDSGEPHHAARSQPR